ncbi:hypothetical protein [Stakelama tenebrarum]|uniref:Uncharacterized protein n=1 Tax=Stakelama tenebrarum TaxID=2711215 RepID=A0A6G6Y242_9SPHN|nr:hypothetical protein [Sphingosinithalassobacter tenebrarum]QIG79014.1 hypothetical protein G5C33_03920 [Sphingosinithalassobacter tenebrarum]
MLALVGAILGGCSAPGGNPPSAFRRTTDQIYVALGLSQIFGHPCYHKVEAEAGDYSEFIGKDACYRFDPPRHFEGIWRDEFEASRFFPNLDHLPAPEEDSGIWLSVDSVWNKLPPAVNEAAEKGVTTNYRIAFIGRKTSVPGHYGHMGASREDIVVHRIIEIEPLAAATPD